MGLLIEKERLRPFVIERLGFFWVYNAVAKADDLARFHGLDAERFNSPNGPVKRHSPVRHSNWMVTYGAGAATAGVPVDVSGEAGAPCVDCPMRIELPKPLTSRTNRLLCARPNFFNTRNFSSVQFRIQAETRVLASNASTCLNLVEPHGKLQGPFPVELFQAGP